MAKLRFYLDENVPIQVARQLQARGIDVVTVRDLRLLGETDENHLQNAAKQSRLLYTYVSDFIELASSDFEHAGIVFGQQEVHYIGDWVRWLTLMHAVYNDEEMRGRIEYM